MISFQKFTNYGRLGNQLFQYAFLRSTARRLGVKFYCPTWIGDSVFMLNDSSEREKECRGIRIRYHHPRGQPCFSSESLRIQDNTDICGYYQTEKYYQDKDEVRSWYTFRDEAIEAARSKYKEIDFSNSVGLHLRLGDLIPPKGQIYYHYIPGLSYYLRALSQIKRKDNILIFSDDIQMARTYFQTLKGNVIFIKDTVAYEDLYLMSRCRNFISSPSTLSWWAAWLNPHEDKIIIVPREGPLRHGKRFKREALKDYWPKEYRQIRSLNYLMDNYEKAALMAKVRYKTATFAEILRKLFV